MIWAILYKSSAGRIKKTVVCPPLLQHNVVSFCFCAEHMYVRFMCAVVWWLDLIVASCEFHSCWVELLRLTLLSVLFCVTSCGLWLGYHSFVFWVAFHVKKTTKHFSNWRKTLNSRAVSSKFYLSVVNQVCFTVLASLYLSLYLLATSDRQTFNVLLFSTLFNFFSPHC